MGNGYRSNMPYKKEMMMGAELYDYKKDPDEKVNVVRDKKYLAVSEKMHEKILAFLQSQLK
jgi:hypothetical protein